MKEYKFKAQIKASKIGKGGAYVEFPYNTENEFGIKGLVPVIAYFEEIEYRGSLAKMGTSCHILGVKKDIRQKTGRDIGDWINVRLCKDEAKRTIDIHPKLKARFDDNVMLKEHYEKLSFTARKEIHSQLTGAKTVETLNRRLDRIIRELITG